MIEDIVKKTIKRVDDNKKIKSLEDLKKELNVLNDSKDFPFKKALNKNSLSIIAEIKKASPSKGIIDSDFNYLAIAKEYEDAEVDAISVLTEPYFFKGNDSYLEKISKNVKIPIIRKDFIVDEYMIYEAKLIGADAILLIVAILDEKKLRDYIKIAKKIGLSTLVETHSKKEIEIAISCGSEIIGVNNRDLKTFNVDLNTFIKLNQYIPDDVICISESGIKNKEDINLLKKNGVDGVLIGETLMKSENKEDLIRGFKSD
ncbi:MAG: indole-3-glycerol phosphate synthase TrpC [Methanobacteriaceae archaeon]|jgi:indole-3-glycerol phosphate synthase|nr:indole-3-glycerol phosphate synthase TrpC [Methanobacteriaceae archaeon]